MVPKAKRKMLLHWLNRSDHDPQAIKKAVEIIEESGAVIYLNCEIEKNKQLAVEHLDRGDPLPAAREMLLAYLERA